MPDDWEQKNGGDLDPNGHELHKTYDNVEVYLHQVMEEHLRNAPKVKAWGQLMQATGAR
jgi:hypothetical protein